MTSRTAAGTVLRSHRRGPTDADPVLVLLHFFGSAFTQWEPCVQLLEAKYAMIGMDLPGFGESAAVPGYSVAEMADAVAATVAPLDARRVVLVGHSLSGKVAAVLAARPLPGLAGLVLVAPSPPGPEPITPRAMETMLAYRPDRGSAEAYLDANTAAPLAGPARERAVAAFTRADPAAWAAWLQTGSQEDWAARVGTLHCPTLLVTGQSDQSLGLDRQKEHTLPHLANVQTHDLPECGHVPPLEAPGPLAGLIARFVDSL